MDLFTRHRLMWRHAARAAALLSMLAACHIASAGQWVSGYASAAPFGGRDYKVWVPTGYTPGSARPLLMVLHGCNSNPDEMAAATRYNALADREGVVVVYPQQGILSSLIRCWNHYQPVNQARDSGELAIAMAIVQQVAQTYGTDPRRQYVAGFSAGGAMVANLLACHGERFAAGLIHSGGQYKAAVGLSEASSALANGSPYDPDQRGTEAWQCGGSRLQAVPVMIVHGDADSTVNPVNAVQAARQFAQTNDWGDDGSDNQSVPPLPQSTTAMPPAVPGGHPYTVADYSDAQGRLQVRLIRVQGLGHTWSGGPAQPGAVWDPLGPDITELSWAFFSVRAR
jgi:poly(hydroxyalkanoate) depolymerase family esterase